MNTFHITRNGYESLCGTPGPVIHEKYVDAELDGWCAECLAEYQAAAIRADCTIVDDSNGDVVAKPDQRVPADLAARIGSRADAFMVGNTRVVKFDHNFYCFEEINQ